MPLLPYIVSAMLKKITQKCVNTILAGKRIFKRERVYTDKTLFYPQLLCGQCNHDEHHPAEGVEHNSVPCPEQSHQEQQRL